VKRLPAADVTELSGRRDGAVVMGLAGDARLVTAVPVTGDAHILAVTSDATAIRFPAADVRPTGRSSSGVRAVKLAGDARLVAALAVPATGNGSVVVVTADGKTKRTLLAEFPVQNRAGRGVRCAKPGRSPLVAAVWLPGPADLVVVTEGAKTAETLSSQRIRLQSRDAPCGTVLNGPPVVFAAAPAIPPG
jgi:DNA gyrase subunit A